ILGRRSYRRTPTGAESAWSYDECGNLSRLVSSGRDISFEYDALGREAARLLTPELTITSSWDARGRLTSRALENAASRSVVLGRSYEYREADRLTGIDDQDFGMLQVGMDRMGRVTSVQGPDWRESYRYDAVGRLTDAEWPSQRRTAHGTRSYDGVVLRSAGRTTFDYDAHGRVVRRSVRTLSGRVDTWTYSWDAEDRLCSVVTPAGARWEYHYDPLGRRLRKQRLGDDGTTVIEWTDFSWDGPVLAEQTAHGPRLPGPYTLTGEH